MATAIWAAAAEVTIMGGAEDAVITTAGHAVIIVTIADTWRRKSLADLLRAWLCCETLHWNADWSLSTNPYTPRCTMPGLIGYMLAIVVTLGGYFAGLHWMISPPDPWQPNARISASNAQQFSARKKPPVVKPAEAAAITASPIPTQQDTRLATVETSTSAPTSENGTPRPIEPAIVPAIRPAEAPARLTATGPVVEPVHALRREVPATKTRSGNRHRVERNPGRKLQLMVLRTYERSDGKRFTRLLPLNSARNAMAFYPGDQW
jgi:hypothetical protein